MKLILIALVICSPALFAQSFDAKVKSGYYMATPYSDPANGGYTEGNSYYGYYGDKFRISVRDNLFTLVDESLGIRYRLNLAGSSEQSLPSEYLKFLKTASKVKALAGMVDKITVSEIKSATKSGSDEMTGKVNFYVTRTLNVGFIKMKVVVPFKMYSMDRDFRRYDYRTGEEYNVPARVLVFTMLGNPEVAYVRSPMPEADGILKNVLSWLFKITEYEAKRGVMLSPFMTVN